MTVIIGLFAVALILSITVPPVVTDFTVEAYAYRRESVRLTNTLSSN